MRRELPSALKNMLSQCRAIETKTGTNLPSRHSRPSRISPTAVQKRQCFRMLTVESQLQGFGDLALVAVATGVTAFMEKPLDLPLLLRTIDDLLAEPVERRLSRLTGRRPITSYLRSDT